jgi:hypothetical protein
VTRAIRSPDFYPADKTPPDWAGSEFDDGILPQNWEKTKRSAGSKEKEALM